MTCTAKLMSSVERDQWSVQLETELLQGGASFSEWATLASYEAHTCFVAGADISTIIVCTAACETHLRTENASTNESLASLINEADLPTDLTEKLHQLRKLRNSWVHIGKDRLQNEPSCYSEVYDVSLENDAKFAYRILLELLFSNPFV